MTADERPPEHDAEPEENRRKHSALLAATLFAVIILALVAALGGFASAIIAGADAIEAMGRFVHLVTPAQPGDQIVIEGLDPARDQYGLGFRAGDPAYSHAGPPRLACAGPRRTLIREAVPNTDGTTATVSTCLQVDEQALLRISVVNTAGKRLPLAQSGEGEDGSGPPVDSILYRLLVPRVIQLRLQFPLTLLDRGIVYRVRVRATDFTGQSSFIFMPFRLGRGATA